MFDFLADNIVIVALVVIFIVVTRVIKAVRKQSSEDEKAGKSWEDEFRDDSSQGEESNIILNHWEVEKKNTPVIQKKPKPAKTLAQKLEESAPLHAHESAQSADVSGAKGSAAQKVSAPEHHASLSGLEHLPMLKKAFVFSEILAPPKALRDE